MAVYLIHQTADGTPVGIFSNTSHFYLAGQEAHERRGVAVQKTRGYNTPWEEWVDQLGSKSPGPNDRWSEVEFEPEPLPDLLTRVRDESYRPEDV